MRDSGLEGFVGAALCELRTEIRGGNDEWGEETYLEAAEDLFEEVFDGAGVAEIKGELAL